MRQSLRRKLNGCQWILDLVRQTPRDFTPCGKALSLQQTRDVVEHQHHSAFHAGLQGLGIWIGFALTLNHSLRFLHDRPWLGLALGAVAGPFAYWIAGTSWGAVRFAEPVATPLVALALAWGVLTPALAWLAARFERETGASPLAV